MSEGFVLLLLIIFFVIFVSGLSTAARREAPAQARQPQTQRTRRPARRSRRHTAAPDGSQAARDAMKAAGYEAGSEYIQVTDIGLLAYRYKEEPKLVRYGEVLLDTKYLRPFAEVWLPRVANGKIRFELLDHDGRVRYADESRYELQAGSNTLLPDTWLPLAGKVIEPGDWWVRLAVGDTPLAIHRFGWESVGGGEIQRYVQSDGELSVELQQALQSQKAREAVSLSDLLADQEDWA